METSQSSYSFQHLKLPNLYTSLKILEFDHAGCSDSHQEWSRSNCVQNLLGASHLIRYFLSLALRDIQV
ncbi:hypothetical protein LINPERHAP1_LOCUS5748, partial [Linum perenne]